ncbi:hypothetical protein [Emticicia sp. 17c]|uniref:hypothetical protein n=1 Tax=Emticicia sp. 17c TaxID=3127704 RepID=UPI00301C41CE
MNITPSNVTPDGASPDPYKIPLATAKEWINNWLNFDLNQAKITPKEMKAFAVKKQDLQALSNLAPDSNWIRMYIGLEQRADGTYQPHLVMVNAEGPDQVDAKTRLDIKDLIDYDPTTETDEYFVNDYTKVCPPFCDPDSELNN